MFNGISSYFNNLTVGRKLATGFGALVFLTLLVGLVGFLTASFANNAAAEYQRSSTETYLTEEINANLLEAQRASFGFLLRRLIQGYDLAYQDTIESSFEPKMQETFGYIEELRASIDENDASGQAFVDQLDKDAHAYYDLTHQLLDQITSMGAGDPSLEDAAVSTHYGLIDLAIADSDPQIVNATTALSEPFWSYFASAIPGSNPPDPEQTAALRAAAADPLRLQYQTLFETIDQSDLPEANKARLRTAAEESQTAFEALFAADSAIAETFSLVSGQAEAINVTVGEQLIIVADENQVLQEELATLRTATTILQVVLLILASATGIGMALIITRQITRQVNEFKSLFRSVAVGEFDRRAEVFSKDELGQTADAINAMLRQMLTILEETETERAALDAALGTLVATASSADVAEHASESAQQGSRAVADTITAMGRIRDNTQETARRIKRLGEASKEISEVVRLIEEVADRTTVLALNASIQAAAAGDAGRGFAVVAEEVQRLAERATGEARRIENLVKGIQAETNEAVIGVDEATREVVEGTRLAQQAGDQVARLNGLVNELAGLIQGVADSTHTQTADGWNGAVPVAAATNGHSRN